MKKRIIYLSSFILIVLGVGVFIDQALFKPTEINSFIASKIYSNPANDAFTDDNFYKCVVNAYNEKNNTSLPYTTNLSDEQLKTITSLNCVGTGTNEKIESTNGLEKLTALNYLHVDDNQLTEIDISKNIQLLSLSLSKNQLTNLDVSNNIPLTILQAGDNQLVDINLNDAIALKRLDIYNNKLTSLDVSKNTALTVLDVSFNQLTSIDVSKNTALTDLSVGSNQLTSLDVSNNTALTDLSVGSNQLTSLDVSKNTTLKDLMVNDNQLTNLDVSKNTTLKYLEVGNNQLTNLDVSKNTTLKYLMVNDNQLTNLDVSKNTALTDLSVGSNQLTSLDVSNNTALTDLLTYNNQLTKLDVSKNTALTYLDAGRSQLTSLEVSKNTALTYFDAGGNQLANLDVSKNTALTKLYAYDNQLTNLDVSKNTALTCLNVNNNQLTSLDVSNNTALTDLSVGSNQLTNLDVSKNTALIQLDAGHSQLTNLDVSKNTVLKELDVGYNQLTSLDVSNNTALKYLRVGGNKLTSLDVSKNTALTKLEVNNNQLTNLDVSKYIALTYLNVDNNQLTSLDVSKNTALTNLAVNNNPFTTKLVTYKNKSINIENDNRLVKLPEGKNSTLTKISSDNENVIIDENNINIDKIGEYVVTFSYKHDIYTNYTTYSNTYSGTYNIKVVEITSDKYKIDEDKEYIYTGTDVDKNTILNNINLDSECSKVIEDNKLIIKYGDELLKTFKIVNISSTKYDLSKEYIFDNKFSMDNIKVVNGTSEVNNNQLLIKYEDVVLNKYNLVSCNSTKYDMSKDSIKVLDNSIEEFINNIKCINCNVKIFDGNEYKVNGDFGDNDKLRILYGDEVLKEYSLTYGVNGISLVNKKVKLNLDTRNSIKLEYVISPKNADNKEVIWKSSNTDVVTIDNNGVITAKGYGDAVITVTTVDGNYSDNCDVNVSEFITYTITYKDGDNSYTEDYEEGDSVTWKSDITKKGYTLVGWKYNDKEYKLSDKFTMINEDITVTSIWNVNKYTITYEVNGGSINNKTKEVTYDSKYGTLEIPSKKGYSFKGWYKDNGFIDIVDEDTIVSDDKDHTLYAKWEINSYKLTINDGINTNEYTLKYNDEKEIVIPERKGYSFVKWNITGTDSTINNNIFKMGTEDSTLVAEWKLVIPEIKNYKIRDKYITGIKINTNVSDIDLGLDSIYTIKITNKNNEVKTKGLVSTGDIVSIYLDDNLVISYVAVVKGDVTGTGNSSVSDVAKLYQYLKGKIDMEEHYVLAGNVVDTDNEIKIGDVAKLYQFIKGKISSL